MEVDPTVEIEPAYSNLLSSLCSNEVGMCLTDSFTTFYSLHLLLRFFKFQANYKLI